MLERNFILSKGKKEPVIKKIAKIIHGEVSGFLTDMKEPEIVTKIKEALGESDFASIQFKLAGCKVAYNIIHMDDTLTLSSSFDLPRDRVMRIGPFDVTFRIETSYLCLNTAKATEVIQLYLGMEGFATSMCEALSGDIVKAGEIFQIFDESKFDHIREKRWSKTLKLDLGTMQMFVDLKEDLSFGVDRSHINTVVALVGLIQSQ